MLIGSALIFPSKRTEKALETNSSRIQPINFRTISSFVLFLFLLPIVYSSFVVSNSSSTTFTKVHPPKAAAAAEVGVSNQNIMTSTTTSQSSQNNNRNKETSSSSLNSSTELKMSPVVDGISDDMDQYRRGKLKRIKQREAALSKLLSEVRNEKLEALRQRPLRIGVVGFGRFGQFIARSFVKHAADVVVTSRSDYTKIANGMGVKYVSLENKEEFLDHNLDVIVLAVSIMSFDDTVKDFAPFLKAKIEKDNDESGPLIVDVLSVKEHPRDIMLELLPKECDILCTHPMFGPDSGKNGWHGLTFVYERTRIHGVVLDQTKTTHLEEQNENSDPEDSDVVNRHQSFIDIDGVKHNIHEDSEVYTEGMDRMERFLSIWEEEGCRMIPLSCKDHDSHAANSQFVTHLMGRILDSSQMELKKTPIDTKGFESVLKLISTTTADSFDLFYGLYKYNKNSLDTITKLQKSLEDVVNNLQEKEAQEKRENSNGNKVVSK